MRVHTAVLPVLSEPGFDITVSKPGSDTELQGMIMHIDIMNLQNKIKLDRKKLKLCAERALKIMGEDGCELSVLIVDDQRMKSLNLRYRKVRSSTDVLAFSMREGAGLSKKSPVLGDVVISAETARKEAKRRNKAVLNEIYLYLIHGILHLLGHKDGSVGERRKMASLEKRIMEAI